MKKMLLAASAMIALASSAHAADFSFVGTLGAPDQVLFFDFTVGQASTVTLRSYSYAGGTNAQGTVIDRGGFDPILGVYDAATGARIGQNDDGGSNVPADINGNTYDTFFQSLLVAGSYRAAVSVYPSFGPENLNTGTFDGAFSFGDDRTANFAFDVLNVDDAAGPGGAVVPEPATWGMMILGFGVVGVSMRRRKSTLVAA